METLAQQLCTLGLTAFESQVYLGLLRRQLTTAGALAKTLGMKRSTAYTVLDSLIEKGLCSMTQVEGIKKYQAADPQSLQSMLQDRQHELDSAQQLYKSIAKDLKTIHQAQQSTPKVTIYEGEQGVSNLLMKSLQEKPKEILVIGQHNPEKDHIPAYTKKRIDLQIPTRVIAPYSKWLQSEIDTDQQRFRKTYPIKDHVFPASIHIYDHAVMLFTSKKSDPVGVYIENDDIASTLKMVFEILEKGMKKK